MYINPIPTEIPRPAPSPAQPHAVKTICNVQNVRSLQLPRAFRSTGTAPVSPPPLPPRAGAALASYLGSTKVGAPRTCVPRSATGCAPKGRSQVGHFLYCATTTGRQPLQTRAWPHAKRTSRGASSQMMHTRASAASASASDAADGAAATLQQELQ